MQAPKKKPSKARREKLAKRESNKAERRCILSSTSSYFQTVDGNNFAKKITMYTSPFYHTMPYIFMYGHGTPYTPNFNVENGSEKYSRNYFRRSDHPRLQKKSAAVNIEIGGMGCSLEITLRFS